MAAKVTLNSRGLEQVLKSAEMRKAVEAAAQEVADNVRDQNITVGDVDGGSHEIDLPVKVEVYETDRARASVLLAHPAGLAVQAKHGALSKAASAAGIKVEG